MARPAYVWDETSAQWIPVGGTTKGAQGGGTDQVFYENDVLINTDYSITPGKNAGTFGPVEIAAGVTVSIPSGSVWSVV